MKVDAIAEKYAEQVVGLTVRTLDNEESPDVVLIEGAPNALRFLGELLLAMASEPAGKSFFISPNGPGNTHFSSEAKLGIYIHRK